MKKLYILLVLFLFGLANGYSQEHYLGEIRIFSANFAPKGWALCNGQLLPINQNQALFALLGTTYGGNGTTTFALPDLRGRTAIDEGNGHTQGENGGETAHTLTLLELPVHTHAITNFQVTEKGNSAVGDNNTPTDNYYAKNSARGNEFSTLSNAKGGDILLPASTINNVGGNQPHTKMAPYTVVTFIIALQGIFPSQN